MKLNSFEIWAVIVLLLIAILFLRCGFLILPRRYQPKGALAEALGYAPLAALVAICAPEIAKFQMEAVVQGASLQSLASGIAKDWRLLGALALVTTMLLTRTSKRAALYGLAAAAVAVWWGLTRPASRPDRHSPTKPARRAR